MSSNMETSFNDKDGLDKDTEPGFEEMGLLAEKGSLEGSLEEKPDESDVSDAAGNIQCCGFLGVAQTLISAWCTQHIKKLIWVAKIVFILLYLAYLLYACYLDYKRAWLLITITALFVLWVFYQLIEAPLTLRWRRDVVAPVTAKLRPKMHILKWLLGITIVLIVIVITTVIVGPNPNQYKGLGGLIFFVLILFLGSHNPAKVRWRPVLWGFFINFCFALIILKTRAGLATFEFVGDKVTNFLAFTDEGSSFVFGSDYTKHYFAFKILPTIVFFSCVISLLYYIGVMQAIIRKIAFVMQFTMGTSPTESLSCAGNIFVGQTEAPILIRPFLPTMTKSELHAVMTGGFGTIAGGVLAAFIGFGIDPVHLICASVMNAPMALAVSKLFYPETEVSPTDREIQFEKPREQNFIEAAAAGASQSISLVANIAANLIAFLALLAFVNAMLSWFGSMVNYPDLSFELICSYVLWPVAFLMGVDTPDCGQVAKLLGTKIVLNEFIAYRTLSDLIKNRDELCTGPFISKRSEVIVTYALCGFANLSSIGIQLGGIGAMAPSRSADLAKVVIRALIAGTITTCMTACIAGILTMEVAEVPTLCNNITTVVANITGV